MENEAITAYRQRRAAFEATFERHLAAGVVFYSADGILIDDTVEIAPGAVILPGTILRGETKIGAGSVIGPNSLLENVTVGENVKFNASQGYDSVIESGAAIGPFAHIRPDSRVCENVHIGDFVEIKNSTVGKGTSVSHLTYGAIPTWANTAILAAAWSPSITTARPSTATPSGIMRSSAAIRTWWRP